MEIIHVPDVNHEVSRLWVVTGEVPRGGEVVIGSVEVTVVFGLNVCMLVSSITESTKGGHAHAEELE